MGELLEALKGIALPNAAHKIVVEADAVFGQRAEIVSCVEHLEAQLIRLEAELEHLRKENALSKAQDGLQFNQSTGTHIDHQSPEKLHYCTKCLSENRRSPMQDESHGWRCHVCGKYYQDPTRPYKLISSRRGGN